MFNAIEMFLAPFKSSLWVDTWPLAVILRRSKVILRNTELLLLQVLHLINWYILLDRRDAVLSDILRDFEMFVQKCLNVLFRATKFASLGILLIENLCDHRVINGQTFDHFDVFD